METLYNKSGEPYIIEGTFKKGGRTFANVLFLDTGKSDSFRLDATKNGEIKDRYANSVYSIACIGNAKKVGNERAYGVWNNMLARCYVEKDKSYSDYGAKGVSVCDRWKCFEYFLEDLSHIDGFNNDDFNKGLIFPDKDIKQVDVEVKIYSPETCSFVTREVNNNHRDIENLSKIHVIGRNGDEVVYIDNILKFAKERNMSNSGIYECISGKKKYHNGWSFEKWK